ncbi:MAG: hypothetical protein JNK04_04300, partial [Myxococcales bacterium]|nr:hypothetical protein [Myxococcales bacterium]
YYYVVPEEDIADAYPSSRIVYLKLTTSVTGWNPSETLRNAQTAASESGTWDDAQRTLWETILASGWAQKYWPCLGAIMQIAVYPHNADGVSPDDYPYIIDFEPKKRELFESVTAGSEVLSGSANKTSLTKGSTSVSSLEYGASAGFSIGGFGADADIKKTSSDTTVNQNTTDTSREARETVSRTTSSSQMYQLFNGYHLGTNRALFVVAPRPHTVSSGSQTEFNLIDGERKLEGIQDIFLVVHMPRSLSGLCVQAGLDTGHQATVPVAMHHAMRRPIDDDFPDPPPDDDPPPPPPQPGTPFKQLVITRRVIQSCGVFDENGNLRPLPLREPPPDRVVGEVALPDLPVKAMFRTRGATPPDARFETADNLNRMQSQVNRLMLDSASSVAYTPRSFVESEVFKSLVSSAATRIDVPLDELVKTKHLTADELALLRRNKMQSVSDFFSSPLAGSRDEGLSDLRRRLVGRLLNQK